MARRRQALRHAFAFVAPALNRLSKNICELEMEKHISISNLKFHMI